VQLALSSITSAACTASHIPGRAREETPLWALFVFQPSLPPLHCGTACPITWAVTKGQRQETSAAKNSGRELKIVLLTLITSLLYLTAQAEKESKKGQVRYGFDNNPLLQL